MHIRISPLKYALQGTDQYWTWRSPYYLTRRLPLLRTPTGQKIKDGHSQPQMLLPAYLKNKMVIQQPPATIYEFQWIIWDEGFSSSGKKESWLKAGTASRFWWVGQWVSVDRITCSILRLHCMLDRILELEEFVGHSVKCVEHIHTVSRVGRYVYVCIYILTSFYGFIYLQSPSIFVVPQCMAP